MQMKTFTVSEIRICSWDTRFVQWALHARCTSINVGITERCLHAAISYMCFFCSPRSKIVPRCLSCIPPVASISPFRSHKKALHQSNICYDKNCLERHPDLDRIWMPAFMIDYLLGRMAFWWQKSKMWKKQYLKSCRCGDSTFWIISKSGMTLLLLEAFPDLILIKRDLFRQISVNIIQVINCPGAI